MKQIARCEFGGGLSEISLNKLIIKLIKKNIRIPSGSLKKGNIGWKSGVSFFFVCLIFLYSLILDYFCYLNARRLFSCYIECYG